MRFIMIRIDDIKRCAQSAGFDGCGVTRVHLVEDEVMGKFDAWLEEGCAGGMEYLHRYREIRRNPELLLEGARTMVCLAVGYTPGGEIEGMAHYAYGRDYHEVVREMGREFAEMVLAARGEGKASEKMGKAAGERGKASGEWGTALREMGKASGEMEGREKEAVDRGEYRVCVDTAPILERYWAAEAGLGWIGRNHQLIVPRRGSEFFLCEVLFTEEVDEVDVPLRGRCGTCRKCLEACPTGALREDGVLDAQRCNSYLTIEHRGEWEAWRPSAGCLYGCDVCQKVCPWQRFARVTDVKEFVASEELVRMKEEDWRKLTREKFAELFRGSAVKRVKYEGLMRNVVWALGEAHE